MKDRVPPHLGPTAEKVMNAIVSKMRAHAADLEEGKTGNIRWRKQKGEVEVEFTTTK